MTELDALYSAALLEPADDTVRLVLADRLRESDDPADQALGRFIWGGVVSAGYRTQDLIEDPLYYAAIEELAGVSSKGWPIKWLSETGFSPSPASPRDWIWDSTRDRVTFRCVSSTVAIFARGMLAEVSLTLGQWYALAPRILSWWPLEMVRVSDVPGLVFKLDTRDGAWLLTACLTLPRRRRSLIHGPIPAALISHAVIVEEGGEWNADDIFTDREELIEKVAVASTRLIADLAEAAGDRWPSPTPPRCS